MTSSENAKSALSGGLLQANVDYDPDYTELVFMDECGTSSLAGNSMSAPDPYFSLAAVIINSRFYSKSDGQHGLEIVDMVANPLRKAVLREYGHLTVEMDMRERTFMDCTSERIFQKDRRRRDHGLKLYPV
ncbi:MAG: hypothetical protein IPG71_07020 [bacterium]|nr:hypothetical protein [bacterium]